MNELKNVIGNMQQFKILIVDDKSNMRRTIKNMLRTMGFSSFREAEDGDVAYKKIKAEKFDFVICDWNMPRMKGVEVLRKMREDDRYNDLPFLMITAEVEEGRVAESIEADVDAYILKPFVIKTLEDKMLEILSKKKAPSPLDTQLQLADVFLKAGNFAQSHNELDKAARLSRKSPKLFFQRGLVFEAEGRAVEAEKSFLLARQLGPKYIKPLEKLVEIYESKGRTSEMVGLLSEVVRISPNNADRQTRLGKALLEEGRKAEAKECFKLAIKLDPNNMDRRTEIGEAYLAQDMALEAEETFKDHIEAHPDDIDAYNRLGIALRRQQKFDEAISYYRKALEIEPEEEYLHYNLARAYMGTKNTSMAVAHLRKAVRVSEDFKEAKMLLKRINPSEIID